MALPDAEIVAALKRGDESVFADLVDAYSPGLMRMAQMFVRDRAVAEEVVQETWLAVLRGIDRFEGRSSLKTWIFRILMNTAKTRGQREARSIPFSSALPADPGGRGEDLGVDPDRFFSQDHAQWPGHWRLGPAPWGIPDERLLAKELRGEILEAVDGLSDSQREVLTLRDIAGWDSKDVCNALGLSEVNQRVLLHRARSKVRAAVEDKLGAVEETT
jgi:RNA polymerase sigma-70 factor (ECF subfamily)